MSIILQLPSGQRISVEASAIVIGRGPSCNVALTGDGRVQPRHATIRKMAGKWMVQSEGDWLIRVGNGVPGGKAWVNPGEEIHLTETGPIIVFMPTAVQQQEADPDRRHAATPHTVSRTSTAAKSNPGGDPAATIGQAAATSALPQQPATTNVSLQRTATRPRTPGSGGRRKKIALIVVGVLVVLGAISTLIEDKKDKTGDSSTASPQTSSTASPKSGKATQPASGDRTPATVTAKELMDLNANRMFQWRRNKRVQIEGGWSDEWVGNYRNSGGEVTITIESVNEDAASVTLIESGNANDVATVFGHSVGTTGRIFATKECMDWIGDRFDVAAKGKIQTKTKEKLGGYGVRYVCFRGITGVDFWNLKLVEKLPHLKDVWEDDPGTQASEGVPPTTPPPASGRELEVHIGTAGGKGITSVLNSALKAVKCHATSDSIVIDFDLGSTININAKAYPLLVRLFDRNGEHLTHFTTAEGFTDTQGTFDHEKLLYERATPMGSQGAPRRAVSAVSNGPGSPRETFAVRKPVLLKRTGNRLTYTVNMRDLRDAAAVEVGFDGDK
jgi:hypothetical protein